MPNPKDITDPTTAMNMELVLIAKAFKLNYSTPTNNKQRISSNPRNRKIAQPVQNVKNQNPNKNGNAEATWAEGNAIGNNGNQIRCYNCTTRRRDVAYLQTQLLIAQKEEAGIQLQAKEFYLMAAAADLDEIEEVNANCILMSNLQRASTSVTQTDKAPVYDSDGSAKVHNYDNYYDNKIFNMFTQGEQYTELLEPIPKPHQVQQNDSNVISEVSNVKQDRRTIDQHPATVEETRAYFESLYNNLAIEVEKVNTINLKLRETNVDLTTELARYKNQEKKRRIAAIWLEKVVTPLIDPAIKGFAAALAVLKPKRLKVDKHGIFGIGKSDVTAFDSEPLVEVEGIEKYLFYRKVLLRVLIEVNADKELKMEVVMAVSNFEDEGRTHTLEKVRVEYEWKPPICIECNVFGHTADQSPKEIVKKPSTSVVKDGDSFTTMVNRKNKGKGPVSWKKKAAGGFKVNNVNNFIYQPVKPKENASKTSTSAMREGLVFQPPLILLVTNIMMIPIVISKRCFVRTSQIVSKGQALPLQKLIMFSIASWNIRGLNQTPKQSEVRQVINKNLLSVFAILESHVDISLLSQVYSKVFKAWEWTSNANLCTKGNKVSERRVLWSELGLQKQVVRGCPWILLGDFNVALNLEDSFSGSSLLNSAMLEFKDCVLNIEVMDINSSGFHFTWNQKPKGGGGILRKLDRIMGNLEFLDVFSGGHAHFHPYHISDHSPTVLKILDLPMNKPKPFKFFNFVTHKSKFLEILASHWNVAVPGHHMYHVVSKLKALKKPLRKLVHDHGNLHECVNKLRHELDEVQKALDLNPTDQTLCEEEAVYVQAFNKAKSLKSQNQRSRIKVILNADNVEVSSPKVPNVFVQHYEKFFGTDMACVELNYDGLFHKQVLKQACSIMIHPLTDLEIKTAMFSIGDDKAPGPNGYTSAFFKKGWDILGQDVCKAVHDFFINGQLLKEINHAFIALIPKVSTPHRVNNYRPISCCNVIYKCISKIITNRIIEGIKEVVSDNQLAFVPGRRISDNILLTQELMYAYHRDIGPPRGDVDSARVIRDSLEEFTRVSGLVPSLPKSTAFFCNVANHVKLAILNTMPFSEGKLPVIYLGVTLIPTRLFNRDCKFLVEKARNRIGEWKNKSLSFAGILFDIEQLMRGFYDVMVNLSVGKKKLHGIPFVFLKVKAVLAFVVSRWCDEWPLIHYLSLRDISHEGFSLLDKVSDMVSNEGWKWPQSWLLKAPILGQLNTPLLYTNMEDTIWWPDGNGTLTRFSVTAAWDAFRNRGTITTWHHIVWFSHNVPRNAFLRWLIMHNSLKMLDKLRQWDVAQVWTSIRHLAGMDTVLARIEDIVSYLQPIAHQRTVLSVIRRLLLVASAYYIWDERNKRVFKHVKRSWTDIRDIIITSVRLKLFTLKFKNKVRVIKLLAEWKMPNSFRLYGS
nr:hypothetical protein [Tanacetum cinerariifolium]